MRMNLPLAAALALAAALLPGAAEEPADTPNASAAPGAEEAAAAPDRPGPAGSAESGGSLELGGTISSRAFAAYSGSGAFDAAAASAGTTTALELRLDAESPSGDAGASAAIDAFARSGAALASGEAASARIRELFARLDFGAARLEAGRLVLNYGRLSSYSPADLFSEYDRSGPWPVRLGTDAARLRLGLGATGALEAVAAPPSLAAAASEGRYMLRASGLVGGVDAAALGAWDGGSGDWIAGAELKADAGVGLYGEGIAALAEGRDARFRAGCGADWSAALGDAGDAGKLVLRAEYCYDGMPGRAAGAPPGAHNAYAAATWASGLASASIAAGLSWPGDIGTLSALASVDAARGASLSLYGLASWAAGKVAAQAGLALAFDF